MVLSEKFILHHKGIDSFYRIWHTTGNNMIIYFHNGTGSIVTAEKSYNMEKGVICFIGSDKFHYTLPEIPTEYDRSKIFVSSEILSKILALFPKEMRANEIFNSSSIAYAKINEKEQVLIETLLCDINNSTNPNSEQSILNSVYMRLLLYIYDNVLHTSSRGGILQRAIEYINANIYDDLSIDKICDAVHISKYHFCRNFKAVTGNTVMDYVLKTRIINAKNMLITTEYSISEISERCGFCSISYFCRVFKESEGVSPLKYRKQKILPRKS